MTTPNNPAGLNVPPPPTGSGTGGGPLGLPAGARVTTVVGGDTGRGRGRPGGGSAGTPRPVERLAPQGTQGGQRVGGGYTEEDVFAILASLPVEDVARIQRQMQVSGLIGPETRFTLGQPDDKTKAAFKELLGIANTRSTTWRAMLDTIEKTGLDALDAEQSAKTNSAGGGAGAPQFSTRLNTYERSDPAGVRQTLEQAFQQALGRKPKKSELEPFVNSFLERERGSQATVFGAQDRLEAQQRNQALGLGGGAPGDPVDALMQAIGTQESGNNYNARNGRTGASGKFQIMPANWPAWAREAGLGSGAAQTPENQERVARFKMSQYVEQFGQDGAAVAWYAGPGAARQWLKNSNTKQFTRKQGKGNEPSINEYVQQVMGRLGNGGGGQMSGARSESDELWARLQQLAADAPGGKLGFGKRTRSYEEQVALKAREKRGGPKAATPGKSKHGDGRANDLKYASEEQRAWVLANAARYGLAFPIYDPSKPRTHDESWHVELAKGANPQASYGQAAPGGVPISENITVQRQDLGAQAVEYARNVNPDETAAYEIGGQFNNLLQILQRGVV